MENFLTEWIWVLDDSTRTRPVVIPNRDKKIQPTNVWYQKRNQDTDPPPKLKLDTLLAIHLESDCQAKDEPRDEHDEDGLEQCGPRPGESLGFKLTSPSPSPPLP